MKIIFVRHGHPDYSKDCLTELGHPQAEAAAERLKNEKIDRIFSSSCGRAVETAQHIAARHNLEITQLDFMREISWGIPDTEDFVHPWSLSDGWVKNGIDLMNFDWQNTSDYSERTVVKSYNDLAASFDKWLSEFKESMDILGLKVPMYTIPVNPGRNLAIIIEVAAINFRLKKMGYNSARELLEGLGMDEDANDVPLEDVDIWHTT